MQEKIEPFVDTIIAKLILILNAISKVSRSPVILFHVSNIF